MSLLVRLKRVSRRIRVKPILALDGPVYVYRWNLLLFLQSMRNNHEILAAEEIQGSVLDPLMRGS